LCLLRIGLSGLRVGDDTRSFKLIVCADDITVIVKEKNTLKLIITVLDCMRENHLN